MSYSVSREGGEPQPAVFLSHSGKQKVFVEYLYDALLRAHHSVFFDKKSLDKASAFPSNIRKAVCGCKLGVLVLSDDYLSSKWPMLELGMLFANQITVLPLFYQITTENLKSSENLSKWKHAWTNMMIQKQVAKEQVEQWEKAVKMLPTINGIVYKEKEDDIVYIENVVKVICALIPSNVVYDLSYMQGHQSLAKEIKTHFDELVDAARQCGKASMVGLYGIGGMGKTTLCKNMVNFFTSQYLGRSCLIEFPTDCDKSKVVKECKIALKKLANLDDHVLWKVNDFDQVVKLMMDYVPKFHVFLAIDNVWPAFEEDAVRLLGIGFTADSKVLLTCRSEEFLRNLLYHHTENGYIGLLPAPNYKEAFQIFQKSLDRGDLTRLPVRNEIDRVLKRFMYNDKYHPLALKALGGYVRSHLRRRGVSEMAGHDWSRILKEIDCTGFASVNETVHNAIKLNFEGLEQHKKNIFLDVAAWKFLNGCLNYFYNGTYVNALQWLRFLYNEKSDTSDVTIYELAVAGVIQIEKDSDGQEMISVHDLYLDLAQKEATRSPRFLTSIEEAVKKIKWEQLERVVLDIGNCHFNVFSGRSVYSVQEKATHSLMEKGDRLMEKLQAEKCEKVQFLYASNIETRRGMHLESMPSLRALILIGRTDGKARGFAANHQGTSVNIHLNSLVQLEYMHIEGFEFVRKFEGLNAILNLQIIFIGSCPCLESLDGLECLTRLVTLVIRHCEALKRVPDLARATCLQKLNMCYNISLEELGHLSFALKEVCIGNCWALGRMPDLGGLTGLERLTLKWIKSLEEVGCLSSSLKEVRIENCEAFKRMPDLGGITALERLMLRCNKSLKEVGCLSPALKEISIEKCGVLKRLPDLDGVTGLRRLTLKSNVSLEVVGRLSPVLKEIRVTKCGALKRMLEFGGVNGLERLTLERNESLEEVGCLGPALKEVHAENCGAGRDLCGTTGLDGLMGCDESLAVGHLSPALKEISIRHCGALKRILDLAGMTGLERLMEDVGCLNPALKEVRIENCGVLKRMPDLSVITGLKRLTLYNNKSLEELGHLCPALKEVYVENCGALKRMPGFGLVTGLEMLTLSHNESLEEVGHLSPALMRLLIYHCSGLRRPNVLQLRSLVDQKSMSEFSHLHDLEHVIIEDCGGLTKFSVGIWNALKVLEVRKCETLEEIEDLCQLWRLEELVLYDCRRLKDRFGHINELCKRGNLIRLEISHCPGI